MPVMALCRAPRARSIFTGSRSEQTRGLGLGRALMRRLNRLRATGGGKLIAETSSREQYAPTQGFYRSCGFFEEARIRDYYAPGETMLYFYQADRLASIGGKTLKRCDSDSRH